jgi:peptidoglycan/xylan/chitin deacetylase (PgdA/CDA1 family)
MGTSMKISALFVAITLAACGGSGDAASANAPVTAASAPVTAPVSVPAPAPAPAPAPPATGACSADRLGTARTLTLKREAAAYGKLQYAPLALAKGEVVLTFDDGPRPETIAKVLDALAGQCVLGTFFMTGRNMADYPALAREVVSKGHAAALHSFNHPHLSQMTAADQLADFEQGIQAYSSALGSAPAAYRFPFLEDTPTMLNALKTKNMTAVSADIGIDDWYPNDMSKEELVRRLLQRLEAPGGGIILLHDANGPTADALPALLQALKDKGYKAVHVRWEE